MEWNVKRAGNVDVERAHLNKILREIETAVDAVSSNIDGGSPESIYLITQELDGGTP